jgi:hypothetical protein
MWPLLLTIAATQGFRQLDKELTQRGYRKPYYGVHVAHNALIVLLTLRDVWRCFTDFGNDSYSPNWIAESICYALHMYHVINYWKVFYPDDWLHHILMIGVALPLSHAVSAGSLLGMNLFFTTGLPGGISYALLFAERNGWITREQEKSINVPVHLWLRAPGCIAHAALSVAQAFSKPSLTAGQGLATLLIAALTFWNGIYFMNQVVRAAERQINTASAAQADVNSTAPNPPDRTTANPVESAELHEQ